MSELQVKASYLTKDSEIQNISKDLLIERIKFVSETTLVEYLTKNVRKVYFDVDYHERFEFADSKVAGNILGLIVKTLFEYFHCHPDSICHNQIVKTNANSDYRLSWHFTLPYKLCYETNKKIAEKLNHRLKELYSESLFLTNEDMPSFDTSVYKSKQSFRLVNQLRPVVSTKTQSVKTLIFGNVENTIVQDCSHLPNFEEYDVNVMDLPDNAMWFYTRLDDVTSVDYWQSKSSNYSEWMEFAVICVNFFPECKNTTQQHALKNLFLKFSKISQKYEETSSIKMFENMWNNRFSIVKDTRSKKLEKKWKKDYEKMFGKKDLCKPMDLPDFDIIENLQNTDFKSFSKRLEGLPITSTGFFIKMLLNNINLATFWYTFITRYEHLQFFCQVLKFVDDEEKKAIDFFQETLNTVKETTGVSDDPHEEDNLSNYDFILFLCEELQISLSEEQIISLKKILDDSTINKKAYDIFLEKIDGFCVNHSIDIKFVYEKLSEEKNKSIYTRAPKELECKVNQFIVRILNNQLNWKYQYPYYKRLHNLFIECEKNEKIFWYALIRASNYLFVSEPYYNCLCKAHSDDSATKIVLDLYQHWMTTPQGVFMFDNITGMWTDKKTVWNNLISMLSNFLQCDPKKNYGSGVENSKKIIERIHVFVDPRTDKFDSMKDSSLGKLLFGNGYYDAKLDVFYEAHLFNGMPCFVNNEILFLGRINDPFYTGDLNAIKEEMDEMNQVMFVQMHGNEIGEYHKECLSLALFGERYKGFYSHVGEPNSGKSTEKAMIEACFGSFVGSGLVDELSVIKDDKRDAAIANSMVYDNWHVRLLLFSEKSNRKIDTEKLKSYSSGGQDKIRARTQFKTAVSLDIHFIMFFYLNHPMEVNFPDDAAYKDRACIFHWDKSFELAENITDPTCQIVRRDDVCQWQYSLKKRQVYTMLFVEAFRKYNMRGNRLPKPDKVKLSTVNTIGSKQTNNDMLESFLGYFIVDGDHSDYVLYTDIQKICKDAGIDPKTFLRRLPTIMNSLQENLPCPIVSAQKRMPNNVRSQIWKGLRIRTDEMAPEPLLSNFEQWKKLMIEGNGKIDKKIQCLNVGEKRTIENVN